MWELIKKSTAQECSRQMPVKLFQLWSYLIVTAITRDKALFKGTGFCRLGAAQSSGKVFTVNVPSILNAPQVWKAIFLTWGLILQVAEHPQLKQSKNVGLLNASKDHNHKTGANWNILKVEILVLHTYKAKFILLCAFVTNFSKPALRQHNFCISTLFAFPEH